MSIHLVNQAPKGTKIWVCVNNYITIFAKLGQLTLLFCSSFDVGSLAADEGFFTHMGGLSTVSNPKPESHLRKLAMISVLIEHPTEGLLLFETGAGKEYPELWGAPLNDIFARVDYTEDQELDVAIAKTGHNIKDVKGVIMGHLHLDHAGGLEYFAGTETPIYVHEIELKHAFYSVASKSDLGVYLAKDLRLNMNWKPFHGSHLELVPGLDIHHSPGHTPGLCILQVNLPNSGTWIFTSDQYHVKENYFQSVPSGWLARDHDSWVRSNQMIHALQKRTDAKIVLGHCRETLSKYKLAPEFYD